jgi:Glycoside hydrolase 123, catalytic domain/Glycoside hydrolase 123 N-terminal domain
MKPLHLSRRGFLAGSTALSTLLTRPLHALAAYSGVSTKKRAENTNDTLGVPTPINAKDTYTSTFDWFASSDLARVFEDGYNAPLPRGTVDVFGIRGETVSAQCVMASHAMLANVTVEVSPLTHENGSASLAADAVRWNFVGNVPVPQNSARARLTHVTRVAPARFPDYLSEERSISLEPDRYQGVWLTIAIPTDAVPGLYRGTVSAKSDRGSAALPVSVRVYPPRMPVERHLMMTQWYSTRRFPQLHGTVEPYTESFYEILKVYAENMASHRENVFLVDLSSILTTVASSGKLSFDFSRFDRWAEIFWNTNHMDALETGFVAHHNPNWYGGMALNDWPAVKQGTHKTVRIKGKEYLPQFLPVFEQHLREKGWLNKTLFHIADEPAPWAVSDWRKASELVHKYAPALRRIDAIEATDFRDDLEVWVPKLPHIYHWFPTYKKAQREGKELWYYMAMAYDSYPNRFIDFPLIETRILSWLNYRLGLTGFLTWGFNQWTDNPYQIMNRIEYGVGDAWVVYPKKGGLIDSVRWEATRNGLQDYEYLWLLQDKIAEIKAKVGPAAAWLDPAQRGVELAGRVIRKVNDFTDSPEVLYRAKAQVLRELMDLDRSPHLLVQTNPPEGSTVISDDGQIEVFGHAEPGTEVKLNGKVIPLDSHGCFTYAAALSPVHNVVVVTARNPMGEQTAERSFQVIQGAGSASVQLARMDCT